LKDVVVFDFDGVLADTLDEMLHIARLVCETMGYPCQPSPADLNALNRMEFAELGKQLGIPGQLVDEFVERTFRMFCSRPVPPRIFPGMREVVVELAKRSKIGILTGNTFQVVDHFLETNNLSAAIDIVLSADAPGNRLMKLKRIVSQLGGPEGKAYLVGDAVSDIQAARDGAVTSIAVTWGHQLEAKLRSVNPDYLVHTPQELLCILLEKN
jgi:phosphoglycolate phosphatase-like HAD superfamily hydrolase